jgi:hypothetical protein
VNQVNIFLFLSRYNLFQVKQIKLNRGINMTDLNKDLFSGGLFLGGIFSFLSGTFVIASALFATAAVFNNVLIDSRQTEGI